MGFEAIATPKNNAKTVVKFVHKNIIIWFGEPKAIISHEGRHFCNRVFATIMAIYGVKLRRVLAYHPQSNGQAEISNHELKD